MNQHRRHILMILLGVLLCCAQVVAAEPVRIALITVTRGTVVHPDAALRYSERLAAQVELHADVSMLKPLTADRLAHQRQKEQLLRIHQNSIASDAQVPVGPFEIEDPSIDAVQVVTLNVSDQIAAELRGGNSRIAEYLMRREQIDMLLVVSLIQQDSLVRLRVEAHQRDGSVTMLHEDIALLQDSQQLLDTSELPVLHFFTSIPLSALTVAETLPGLRLSIDNRQVNRDTLPIIIPSGAYELRAEAPGMIAVTQTVYLEPGEVYTADITFMSALQFPLLVRSHSGLTEVSIPPAGGRTVPFVLPSQQLPTVLYATESGFQPQVMHITTKQDEVLFSLQPSWVNPIQGTAREQDALYASLGRTVLFTGLTILIDSLIRSAGADADLLQPMMFAAAGATGVSLVDTSFRLFAYYRKTKYSSRYWNNEVLQQ